MHTYNSVKYNVLYINYYYLLVSISRRLLENVLVFSGEKDFMGGRQGERKNE